MNAASAADKLKEAQAKAAAARASKNAGAGGRGGGRSHAAPVRQKPIRKTVDMPPQLYRQLDVWLGEAATELGRSRVTGQEVFVALVAEMLANPGLAATIRDRLADET